jgi:hypothetical protein
MFDEQEEEILCCHCGGNLFHMIKLDDVRELECIGCESRKFMTVDIRDRIAFK